ncbi:MAG TPA: lysylphosphatidylglycerol synthase domain-containing protein, partial [Gaiellales bacterium]|nr:lysylphosphatidylglycerol synthase domain-containing protein [Gaiellales bacterium]
MQDELSQLGAATAAWGDRFGDTHLIPLAIALLLHLASLIVRAGVWRGILAAAFPDRRVPMRSALLAYLAGIGANVIAPFRGGDVIRVVAIRRELDGASVTTIVSTLVAETVFGAVVVAVMVFSAAGLGWLPPIVHLPAAGAFEISFTADHALLAAGAAALVA